MDHQAFVLSQNRTRPPCESSLAFVLMTRDRMLVSVAVVDRRALTYLPFAKHRSKGEPSLWQRKQYLTDELRKRNRP